MLFFLITIQQKTAQKMLIIKELNEKTLLEIFGLILNLIQKEKEEKEEKEEREKEEKRNDKKTPPLQQVAPVLQFSQTTLTH